VPVHQIVMEKPSNQPHSARVFKSCDAMATNGAAVEEVVGACEHLPGLL
jgi:hypothetical protein